MSGGVVETASPGHLAAPGSAWGVGSVELDLHPASGARCRAGAPSLRVWLCHLDVGGGGVLPAPPGRRPLYPVVFGRPPVATEGQHGRGWGELFPEPCREAQGRGGSRSQLDRIKPDALTGKFLWLFGRLGRECRP